MKEASGALCAVKADVISLINQHICVLCRRIRRCIVVIKWNGVVRSMLNYSKELILRNNINIKSVGKKIT